MQTRMVDASSAAAGSAFLLARTRVSQDRIAAKPEGDTRTDTIKRPQRPRHQHSSLRKYAADSSQ